jgi:ABC-2 type transport system permease protein
VPNKAIMDVLVVFWLQAVEVRYRPLQYLSAFATFPVGMLILTRYLLPEGVEAGPRLVAGTIIFSVGLGTVQSLPQVIAGARSSHQLELFVTSPIHKLGYASGIVLYWCALALVNTCCVLFFAFLFGIDFQLNPLFLPIALLTALSLTGVAIVIGTWAPTMRAAATMSNLAGILLVLVSPIYFPASRLPQPLETLANLSPYSHAASALTAILSGSGAYVSETLILAAITAVGLSVGVVGMRWREA